MNALRDSMRTLAEHFRCYGSRIFEGRPSARPPAGGVGTAERERLIQRILSTIHNNSILLCGKPGSGKTSILLHLKERLASGGDRSTEFFSVYIDLHGVPEWLLFATVGDAVLTEIGLAAPSRVARFGSGYSHRDLSKDFRHVMRMLRERTSGQPRLVLLIDGIDELNHYKPWTTQRVRSLFMASFDGNLVMVATAVAIDKHWEQEGSPWYNFFEEIELPPVRRAKTLPG